MEILLFFSTCCGSGPPLCFIRPRPARRSLPASERGNNNSTWVKIKSAPSGSVAFEKPSEQADRRQPERWRLPPSPIWPPRFAREMDPVFSLVRSGLVQLEKLMSCSLLWCRRLALKWLLWDLAKSSYWTSTSPSCRNFGKRRKNCKVFIFRLCFTLFKFLPVETGTWKYSFGCVFFVSLLI